MTKNKLKLSDQMLADANRRKSASAPRRDDMMLVSYSDWLAWVKKVRELEEEMERFQKKY